MNRPLNTALLFILLAVVLFGISMMKRKTGPPKPNLEAYAADIDKKLLEFTEDFQLLIADSAEINNLIHEKLKSPFLETLLDKPYSFLIYQDDEPIFWNKNQVIPPSFLVRAIKEESNFLKFQNGYYVINKKVIHQNNRDFSLVGLIPVKTDFFVENNYLKNRFNPALHIPDCIELSTNPQPGAAAVNINGNKNLFFLTLNEPVFNSIPDYRLIAIIFIAFVCLFLSVQLITRFVKTRFNGYFALIFLAVAVISIRWLTLFYNYPYELFELNLFNPLLYASSNINKSLGDLLINIILAFWIVVFFFRNIRIQKTKEKQPAVQLLMAVFFFLIIFFTSESIGFLLKSLLLDSKIPFDFNDFLSLNGYSLIGLVCIALAFVTYFLLAWKLLRWAEIFAPQERLRNFGLPLSFIIYLAWLVLQGAIFIKIISALLIAVFIFMVQGFIKNRDRVYSLSNLALVIIVFSFFSSIYLYKYNQVKDFEKKKSLARKLSIERDLITEYLFIDVQEGIMNDLFIRNYFRKPFLSTAEIVDRIKSKYFSGFFSKYEVSIYTLNKEGKLINSEEGRYLDILTNDLLENAQQSISDYLFFIPKPSGSYAYISNLPILYRNKLIGSVVLELEPKTYSPTNLYPELLLEEQIKPPEVLEKYSYALYSNDILIKNGGNYPYRYRYSFNDSSSQDYTVIPDGNLEHLIFNAGPKKKAVITDRRNSLIQPVSLFSYQFCIFLLFAFLIIGARLTYNIIMDRMFIHEGLTLSFRDKIQFSMIAVIVFTFLAIGWATISHIGSDYRNYHEDRLIKKQKAILTALEYAMKNHISETRGKNELSQADLVSLSDIHEMDINIYGLKGNIINTSQPEIFEKGLFSNMMDPEAFRNLTVNKKAQFTHDEKVGDLKFLSAYSPIRNNQGDLVAYLNLPYFAKEKQLNNEISSFLVALVNVYVLLLVFGGFLAYLLADSITRSFEVIGEKLKLVKLGSKNEPIEWNSNDEIGILIREYNKMIGKLEKSAELLAKSEREMAWREMAKQIAHEIKNPLTPMKLSIQHLQRAIAAGDPNVNELVKKVSHTLVEQIDNLSHIASEFSSFAKMPRAQNEVVNIKDVLQSVVDLFNEKEELSIEFNRPEKDMNVIADKNQLISAFNNLVKNASQAIPHGQQGKLKIDLFSVNGTIRADIKDNGVGISEEQKAKVFVPNFTTKSGGTGLGLALTRQIIENAKGKIWFESEVNVGTTFFVELPEHKN